MKKEEILEKSRQSNIDEGMEHAENKGRKIGVIAFSVLCVIITILCLFFYQMKTFYAVNALFWAYCAAEAYGKYSFTKKKTYLVTVILGSIASIAFTANYILSLVQ